MSERYEIRLSGTGGQGVVLAGILLAEAAGLRPGQHVVQTVSYGPQVRGGMSSAELVVSSSEIDHPKPLLLDLLVPFAEEACSEAAGMMKPRGVILIDPELIRQAPEGWVAPVPLRRLAREATGREQMMNIVAVGAVVALSSIADWLAVETAIRERIARGQAEAFLKALQAGRQAGAEVRERLRFEAAPSPED
ncbi:MAG: 2-oxoacid:acceptor oxidoreductase family protein [bacterium]